ncbi:protein Peter pan-like [Montipora foliosa]|uniref:protein Peter pan-like n=1 Tax=Montipora foliosa TaxID=591990 RepID=UPI0035F1444D
MEPEAKKAKRCLFGPPNQEQLQAELNKELKKDRKEMNKKHKFDLEKEEALDMKGKKPNEWKAENAAQQESTLNTQAAVGGNRQNEEMEISEEQEHETPAKHSSEPEASKAKRCLFGPPDHEQLQADLSKELKNDLMEGNEKYDFDFEKGEPLDLKGKKPKYEWKAENAAQQESSLNTHGAVSVSRQNEEMEKISEEQVSQEHETPAKHSP